MFNNPIHQDINEKESSQTESRILADDNDDQSKSSSSSESEKLLEPTEQNIEASQFGDQSSVQQFGNQLFDPDQIDLNQSKSSKKDHVSQNTKNLGAPSGEVRTSGGQLLYHFRMERESERGVGRQENIPTSFDKKKISNDGGGLPYRDERTEAVRNASSATNEKFRKTPVESHQQSTSGRFIASDTNYADQFQQTSDSSRDERKETRYPGAQIHVVANPFPMLSVEQQKQSEQEFKGDLRETANFDPLVQKRDSHSESRGTEKHYNPFNLSKTDEHENMLRPSGDFGFHKNPAIENGKTFKKTELNEITENPAEYRDSAMEDTEKSSMHQTKQSYRGNDHGTYFNTVIEQNNHRIAHGNEDSMQKPEKPAKMIGLNQVFEGEGARDSQPGVPMFKNMFYKDYQNQDASLNSSNQKTDSVISRSRDPSHINRESASKNESGNLKLINLDDLRRDNQQSKQQNLNPIQANIISESNDSYSQEGHRSHLDDSNVYNKIHKVLQEGNDQDDLNETQRQLIQDMNNEQRRTLLTHLLSSDLDPKSGWAERLSSISKALERKSGVTDHGDGHHFINQDDIEFFTKLLDISAIPHHNDNHVEIDLDQIPTPRGHEEKSHNRRSPKGDRQNERLEDFKQNRSEHPKQQRFQAAPNLNVKLELGFDEHGAHSKKQPDYQFQQTDKIPSKPTQINEGQLAPTEKIIRPKQQERTQAMNLEKITPSSKTRQEELLRISPHATVTSSGGLSYTSPVNRLKLRAELQQSMMSLQKDLIERREGLNNLHSLMRTQSPDKPITVEKPKPIQTYEYKPLLSLTSQEAAKNLVENFLSKNTGNGGMYKREERFSEAGSIGGQHSPAKSEKPIYEMWEPRGTESGSITSKKNYSTHQAEVQPFRDTLTMISGAPVVYQHTKKANEEFSNFGKLREHTADSQRESYRSQNDSIKGMNSAYQGGGRSSSNVHNTSAYSEKGRSRDGERDNPGRLQLGQQESTRNGPTSQVLSDDYKGMPNSDRFESPQHNYKYVSNRQSFDFEGPGDSPINYKKTVSIPYDQHQQKISFNDQELRATESFTLSVKPPTVQKISKEATQNINQKNSEKVKSTMPNPKMAHRHETEKSSSREMHNTIKKPMTKTASAEVDNDALGEEVTAISIPRSIVKPTNVKFASALYPQNTFGRKMKGDQASRPVRPPEARKINKDIFCMDCEEFVPLEQVDYHSEYCVKSIENSRRRGIFENSDSKQDEETKIEDLNQKIERIIVKLNDHLRTSGQKTIRPEFSDSCKKLVKIARDVVSEDANTELLSRKMQDFDQAFAPISITTQEQEIGTVIYLQRLFVGLQNKVEIFKDVRKNTVIQLQEQLQIYERETLRRKAELELWQYQTEMLQAIQRNDARNMKYLRNELKGNFEVISQIHSEIASSADQSEDTLGTVESEVSIGRNSNKGADTDREALRRYFYTEAVNYKLTLPANHPGRNLLISELYDQCAAQNIQKEDYVKFIKQQYAMT